MTSIKKAFGALGLCLAFGAAQAASLSYTVLNLSNEGQAKTSSFSGQGYVGMYGTLVGERFNGIFGLEQSNFSRTALQVDVAALTGKTINSAFLEYYVPWGTQQVTLTAFTADGTLDYFWNAPDMLGSANYSSINGNNHLDVTELLKSGLAADTGWFGLHLMGSSEYQWIGANRDGNADAAQVRLVVDFADVQAVPEPAGLLLAGLALSGMLFARRRAQ